MKIQEWLFRTFMGSKDNHQRIDKLQKFFEKSKKIMGSKRITDDIRQFEDYDL